jgi:hypothetical protein
MVQRQVARPGETGSPALPAAPEEGGAAERPRLEGVDLERLAREVYAILERRLIIERESEGL